MVWNCQERRSEPVGRPIPNAGVAGSNPAERTNDEEAATYFQATIIMPVTTRPGGRT